MKGGSCHPPPPPLLPFHVLQKPRSSHSLPSGPSAGARNGGPAPLAGYWSTRPPERVYKRSGAHPSTPSNGAPPGTHSGSFPPSGRPSYSAPFRGAWLHFPWPSIVERQCEHTRAAAGSCAWQLEQRLVLADIIPRWVTGGGESLVGEVLLPVRARRLVLSLVDEIVGLVLRVLLRSPVPGSVATALEPPPGLIR